jgi:hypothetical protein
MWSFHSVLEQKSYLVVPKRNKISKDGVINGGWCVKASVYASKSEASTSAIVPPLGWRE